MRTPALPTPLLVPAVALSAASLAWTTWSLVDLLGAGWIGVTVAAGADIIWASVILAEARGVHVPLRGRNLVPVIGWATLVAVAALLAWHGLERGIPAMAVGGPFLPLGTKCLWLMALADMRDPAALTDADRAQLADEERAMRLDEARHRHELRRREMAAERLLADVSVDFEIELARQDKGRELARRAPIALNPAQPPEPPAEPTAQHPEPTPLGLTSSLATPDEPAAQPTNSFGFSAHLSAQSAQRAEAVEKVAELLAQDPGLTSGQVAEALSVSPATAKRYLREARRNA
ncbi:winged helix-turn-helix transcriptional regulator [Streptomyces sp. NPDC057271]|uniref:winged helix-turn-helix transcriptional regulator n=1 Tax=unclassified Streptomyces TaxID=2593676 RepID=UPI00362C9DF0